MANIGKYEIREKIGSGGFGVVYRGFDPFIHREVAIKTCSSDEDDIRRRFDNEARIAGNLQHRNITTVYDFGHHGDTPYLVQEYLSGEDLDRKVKRKEFLSLPEKLLYLVQIGRGLAFAHDQGVIHRDIKPANIRILEDGTAKIMDFGIARLAQQETSLTKTGLTVGTAAYLAPEQVTGEPIDRRTDIFSYGVLSYELLTFERPFPGPRISNVLLQIAQQPHTPIASFWPECPELATRFVNRCLEKRPQDRYQDCHALLRDLDRILESTQEGRGQRTSNTTQAVDLTPATTRLEVSREQKAEPSATPWPRSSQNSSLDAPTELRPRTTSVEAQGREPSPHRTQPQHAVARTSSTPRLEDLDIGLGDLATPARSTRAPIPRERHRGSPLPWILLGMIVVIVAVIAGWQMGMQGAYSPEPLASEAAPPSAPEESPPVVEQAPLAETKVADEPKDVLSELGTEPLNEAGEIDTQIEAAAEVLPESPPPPAPAVLTIAASWDPRMSFEVAGRNFTMDRERRVELPPGRYPVTFFYDSGDYRARKTSEVSLETGQQRALQTPIHPPGTIQVQAKLASPQGRVWIDGRDLGNSPVEALLSPGSHQVEIHDAAGARSVSTIDLSSNRKIVLTFDLRSQDPPRILTLDR